MRNFRKKALLYSMLFLTSASAPKEKSPAFGPSAFGISCEDNDISIRLLQKSILEKEQVLNFFQTKLDKGNIEEMENAKLYEGEVELLEVRAAVVVRKFAKYYCRHPEKIPKPEEPKLDLRKVV